MAIFTGFGVTIPVVVRADTLSSVGVITWMTSTIWSSQKAWWNKSAILLQGKIKSVKCTIVGHPGQNYPVATVSWKRVK